MNFYYLIFNIYKIVWCVYDQYGRLVGKFIDMMFMYVILIFNIFYVWFIMRDCDFKFMM